MRGMFTVTAIDKTVKAGKKYTSAMSTLTSRRGTAASMIFNRFHPTFTMVNKHSHSVVDDVTERLHTPLLHDVIAARRAKNSAGSVMQNNCTKRRTFQRKGGSGVRMCVMRKSDCMSRMCMHRTLKCLFLRHG